MGLLIIRSSGGGNAGTRSRYIRSEDHSTDSDRVGDRGFSHGGVVFVDGKTIRASDIGALVRTILSLWDAERDADWTDRVVFLHASGQKRIVQAISK